MSRKSSSNRAEFSPDIYENPTILIKHKHQQPTYNNRNGNWDLCRHVRDNNNNRHQLCNSRSLRFLRQLGDKTARMLRFIGRRSSGKNKVVSSFSPTKTSITAGNNNNNNLMRSRSLVDQSESHRAQAIEDCIEFLHSYSSLQRSSSVSSSCN